MKRIKMKQDRRLGECVTKEVNNIVKIKWREKKAIERERERKEEYELFKQVGTGGE